MRKARSIVSFVVGVDCIERQMQLVFLEKVRQKYIIQYKFNKNE